MDVAAPFLRDFEILPIGFESTPAGKDSGVMGGGEADRRPWMVANLEAARHHRPIAVPVPPDVSTGADSSYRNALVSIHDWSNLVLSSMPADEHLFGLDGLVGGRRFFSLELYRAIHQAGLVVHFRPVSLDVADKAEHQAQARALRAGV